MTEVSKARIKAIVMMLIVTFVIISLAYIWVELSTVITK